MQNGKPFTVVAVCVCTELVFHLVALKIHSLAQFDNAVFRHCRRPHQIASCGVILRILNSSTQVVDYTSHKRLGNIVRYIVLIRLAEINLHNVRKNIKAAGNHLLFGNTVSIGGVKQGKFWVALRIISACLDFQFLIGNDCAAVALAARTCHSNDHA